MTTEEIMIRGFKGVIDHLEKMEGELKLIRETEETNKRTLSRVLSHVESVNSAALESQGDLKDIRNSSLINEGNIIRILNQSENRFPGGSHE